MNMAKLDAATSAATANNVITHIEEGRKIAPAAEPAVQFIISLWRSGNSLGLIPSPVFGAFTAAVNAAFRSIQNPKLNTMMAKLNRR